METIDDEKLKEIVAEKFRKMGIKLSICKRCGRKMFFLNTNNDKMMPVNLSLNSHFSDCKFADNFRKKRTPLNGEPE